MSLCVSLEPPLLCFVCVRERRNGSSGTPRGSRSFHTLTVRGVCTVVLYLNTEIIAPCIVFIVIS